MVATVLLSKWFSLHPDELYRYFTIVRTLKRTRSHPLRYLAVPPNNLYISGSMYFRLQLRISANLQAVRRSALKSCTNLVHIKHGKSKKAYGSATSADAVPFKICPSLFGHYQPSSVLAALTQARSIPSTQIPIHLVQQEQRPEPHPATSLKGPTYDTDWRRYTLATPPLPFPSWIPPPVLSRTIRRSKATAPCLLERREIASYRSFRPQCAVP